MTAQTQPRGASLLDADRRFADGGGMLARLVSTRFARVLDRIDAGLAEGAIEAELPGGVARRLGGRAPGPVAVVRLNSWMPLVRLWRSGSVGWYRSWAAGEWECPDPVPLFDLFMRNRAALGDAARAKGAARWLNRLAHTFQRNDRAGAARNIHAHYDLGNDFYAAWLDAGMTYSAAMFEGDDALEAAQARKIRVLLDRLALKPGGRLLEIGCGWGSLAEVAARDYGVHVTALTLSPGQKAHADARMAQAGLAERVDIRMLDYRDVDGTFDAVASVEMVEAVGQAYWPDYLAAIARSLKPGGRAALQYIAIAEDVFDDYARSADFIQAYVFPGGMLLSEARFSALAREAGLGWADRTGFGLDYARTLKCWRERFDRAVVEGRLPAGFDARFIDLWRYYLMYCEGGFRGGGIDVAQVTMTKGEDHA
jgi:cyclopropane-fatty-acyl-phospholipid synthase